MRALLEVDRTVTMQDRVNNYRREFPLSHLCVVNDHIEGLWIIGHSFTSGYSKEWYGAYPSSFLRRISAIFPELKPFHLFSGWVKADWTLDLHKDSRAKIRGDAHNLPLRPESQDLFIADPPYSPKDAQHYNLPMISRNKVLEECWHALKPNGFLVWLDLIYPQFVLKNKYKYELYGLVAVIISTMHRIRQLTLLKKAE